MIKEYKPECFCDRCKVKIEKKEDWFGVKVKFDYYSEGFVQHDLCADCFKDFEAFMKEKQEVKDGNE